MGTANFHYKNRCVHVTDNDYECGNYPELGDYRRDSLRSFPSHKLSGYDFIFWDIVLTSGYYSDACIDYVEKDYARSIDDRFSSWRYDTVTEFCNDLFAEFPDLMSRSKIHRIFSGLRKSGRSIQSFLDNKYDEFVKIAESIERDRVNAAIDKIKEDYGYDELAVSARFSNGETWYSKVA